MPSLYSRRVLLGLPGSLALFSHFAIAAPLALNDNFADAELISGSSGSHDATNFGTSRETNEPSPAGVTSGQSVWYRWTAPSTGIWKFDTAGSDFNTVLGIYTGTVVASLTEIASNDDASGTTSQVVFPATAGTTYYIDVAGKGAQYGDFNLNWDLGGHILGGRITDSLGRPTKNLAVTISGPETVTVTTNAQGYYTSPVLQDGSYTVTPNPYYYTYTQNSRTVDLTESNSTVNFTSAVKPSVSVSNVTVNEGQSGITFANFTLKLSIPSALPISIDYATQNETALSPSDYNAQNDTLHFNPGETTRTVQVEVKGDAFNEPDERFILNLSNPNSNVIINDGYGVGTIKNDDDIPTVSIDSPSIYEGDSGTKTLDFTLTLSAPSNKTITVSAKTDLAAATANTGPATAGFDYVALPATTIAFNPGETTKTISIKVNGDGLEESDETFKLLISAPANAKITNGTGVGTITNDDAAPLISVSDVEVTEGNIGTITAAFTVSLSAASGRAVKVTASTVDFNALGGADYTVLSPTVLTFSPGQTSKVVNVLVKGDLIAESMETFNLQLSDPVNAGFAKSTGIGVIQDNDPKPTITVISPSVVEGNSGTVTLPFVFKLSNPSSDPVNFIARTKNANTDSATADVDYEAIPDTFFVFAPGETTKTVPITIKADLIDEVNEKVALALSGSANATLSTTYVEGTIVDDDAIPALSIDGATISEGNSGSKTLNFTVSLSAPSGKTVSATFKTANPGPGTYVATAGSDYVAVTGTTVTFAPGETSKQVSVTINGDETFEPDERFNGVLSAPVNASISQGTAVATITNDDAPPTVSIDQAHYDLFVIEGDSGSKTVPITINLSAASTQPVVVYFSTQTFGSATPDIDYVEQSGSLTFTPGQTSKTINLVIKGDTVIEGMEQFWLSLNHANGAVINRGGHSAFSVINILDDDATPAISIDSPSVNEGNNGITTLNFTLSLTNPSGKAVRVGFKTAPSAGPPSFPYPYYGPYHHAEAGTDYVEVPLTTVTFAPGETTKTVAVTINGDELYEFNEHFAGVLSNPVNATIAEGSGFGYVMNDDTIEAEPPVISVDAASKRMYVPEGDSGNKTVKVKVNLSSPRNYPIRVNCLVYALTATAGQDFVAEQEFLVFTPGQTSQEIDVKIISDTVVEGDEEFFLLLSGDFVDHADDNRGSAIIIWDDDAPTFSINSPTIDEGNSGTKTLNFTVTLSVPKQTPVSVDFKTGPATLPMYGPPAALAKAGEDYDAITTTTLTFAPGETSKTVAVTVKGDELYEYYELFNGELSNPTNGASIAQGSGVATITNDDSYPSELPSVSITRETSVYEGNSGTKTAKIPVTLSAPMGVPVRVEYGLGSMEAIAGQDFDGSNGFIVFEPGETTKDIEIPINGDTDLEVNERFSIYLYNSQNAYISMPYGIVTILDDDNPVQMSIDSPTIIEGNSGTKTLDFTITLSRASTETVSATFQTGDFTPTPGTFEPIPTYPAEAHVDYVPVPVTTVTFAPGETSKTVSATVNGDELFELDEKFTGLLSEPVNAVLAEGTGVAVISNDDAPVFSTLSLSSYFNYVTEGSDGTMTAIVNVNLSEASGIPVSVQYTTYDIQAISGEDYSGGNGTITFAPGETTKDIEITIYGDTEPEGDELFGVTLQYLQGAYLYDGNAVVVINNDDESAARAPRGSDNES